MNERDVELAPAQARSRVDARHALVVGVSETRAPELKLLYARHDAEELGAVLREHGYAVDLLVDTGATCEAVRASLERSRSAQVRRRASAPRVGRTAGRGAHEPVSRTYPRARHGL